MTSLQVPEVDDVPIPEVDDGTKPEVEDVTKLEVDDVTEPVVNAIIVTIGLTWTIDQMYALQCSPCYVIVTTTGSI